MSKVEYDEKIKTGNALFFSMPIQEIRRWMGAYTIYCRFLGYSDIAFDFGIFMKFYFEIEKIYESYPSLN
jgi:hypothetical protein